MPERPSRNYANVRLIARMDIKGPNLIKGVQLEGVRVVGDPRVHAQRYYEQGADEIIYMDAVASLYQRNSLEDLVRRTAQNIFIPMTVGGGIRSVEDAHKLFRVGADKVAVNTAAVANPALITEIARRFGSQAMILSIEAKRDNRGHWEAYTDCGRERTSRDVLEWAEEAVGRGAGEILLTSVDQEGTCRGFDLELVRAVATRVSVPVIASGGMGTGDHVLQAVENGADAVAMAHVLHFGVMSIPQVRDVARAGGVMVRRP